MSPLQSLKRRPDFLAVAATRRKYVAKGFVLQSGQHAEDSGMARLGFTVSKKVGNAVERNRVKRRLREAARQIMPEKARMGCDYVLIGRKNALTCSFSRILDDLTDAMRHLNKGR